MTSEPIEITPFSLDITDNSGFLDFRPSVVDGAPKDFSVGVSFDGERNLLIGEQLPDPNQPTLPTEAQEITVMEVMPEIFSETMEDQAVDPLAEILETQEQKQAKRKTSPIIPSAPSLKA